jgi:hypothetical protein
MSCNKKMKIYHVTAGRKDEVRAIKAARPSRLLLSYFYFRRKSLVEFISSLGYRPEILIDSGAWSAFNSGVEISVVNYMNYLQENRDLIDQYISMDVIGDSELSLFFWNVMRRKGFSPIPVYHYKEDEKYLKYYTKRSNIIAIGGTVPEPNKRLVADWVRLITWTYPEIKFHLLGSSSRKIIDTVDLHSVDSSTWIMQAKNGRPEHIPGTSTEPKIKRAIYNLEREIYLSEE